MDEQLWYLHTMGYYSVIKRKKSTNIYNMDNSQKHYTKRKMSDTKGSKVGKDKRLGNL